MDAVSEGLDVARYYPAPYWGMNEGRLGKVTAPVLR